MTASSTSRDTLCLLKTAACAALLFTTSHVVAQPSGDAALDAAVAERLAQMGDDSLIGDQTPAALLRQSAAFLETARLYNPNEIRFARSLADVLLRLGERDRALEVLGAIRALDPKDQVAMIQFIDLNADKMETAEARAAYLEQVVNATSVAPEVRSHAAVTLVDLYFQRSQDAQADAMLDKALELNPQNIAALLIRYRIAGSSRAAIERVRALAGVIQASPADPSHLVSMAQECVAVGDHEGARTFYQIGFNILSARHQPPPIDDLIDIIGSEMLRGDPAEIRELLRQALEAIKDDGRLYSLDLLIGDFPGAASAETTDEAAADAAIQAARGVYLAQLAGVSRLLNDPEATEMPATQPAAPMPDVAADAARLAADDPHLLRNAYAVALAEQLWFDLYFRAAPVDDASINALATLLGADDPVVVRFQGWKLLAAGQADEAKVKLDAVADRDGYAKLGLAAVAFRQGNAEEAGRILKELLAARPTGMLSAFAALAAKQQGVSVPMTPQEQEIADLAGPVRQTVINTLTNPRGVYLLSAVPLKPSIPWGEPMLAKVTLTNNGRHPITIGPGAFIEPRFAVDLQLRGEQPRVIPQAVVGRWTGAVRLLPRQSISQTIRLDRGVANIVFKQYPTALLGFSGQVYTNPVMLSNGTVSAPGGQTVGVGRAMERKSSPLYVEAFRSRVLDQMSRGSAVERLNAIDLTLLVIPLLRNQQNNPDASAVADQLQAAVEAQLSVETSAEVKAFGAFALSRGAGAADPERARAMIASDAPVAKLLGLVTGRILPQAQRQELARFALAQEPAGPVSEMAQGLEAQPDLQSGPEPATQPGSPQ